MHHRQSSTVCIVSLSVFCVLWYIFYGVQSHSDRVTLLMRPTRDAGDSTFSGNPRVISGPQLEANFTQGVFAFLFPKHEDMIRTTPLLCKLQKAKRLVIVAIYDDLRKPIWETENTHFSCVLTYDLIFASPQTNIGGHELVLQWLRDVDMALDVIVTLYEANLSHSIQSLCSKARRCATVLRLPRADLPYCGWMGSLTLTEWKGFNIPRLDVSVITNDRPHSLKRLLLSLKSALYFGDTVHLRIQIEQSGDAQTMQLVENLNWVHGDLSISHRIIHAGLLTAVVESWYPSSNDTYGLLLEDDVELSPLFYAWIKMTLLRYRYGEVFNRSPFLFGISLYQQKVVELPPQGRRAFNARTLFTASGFPHASTPFLSPLPCSWGAVYFPQHWKEFHLYLVWRLSNNSRSINEEIVPYVRSNKWTMSWKKYFIELAYLRGYVMLYPNFNDFISLSTNHLEVGSHVKFPNRLQQELFKLPLMQLTIDNASDFGLLDLPANALPNWNSLPVLNLTGSLTSHESLIATGLSRRTQVMKCGSVWLFDARSVMP